MIISKAAATLARPHWLFASSISRPYSNRRVQVKAIRVHQFGGPEVLKLEEIPTLKPEAGGVLVRIRAAGVNPYDTYMRSGTYAIKPTLPYTPGSDAAGVIEGIGQGITKVKVG